jgi:predicted nucleotidyltransferase
MRNNGLADFLFGRTRRDALSLLLTHPDESFHLRDVQRRTGAPIGPLHGELKKLTDLGLVSRTQRGRQVFFQANRTSPIFSELQAILIKTAGVGDVLRRALREAGLADKIRVAFVFGSVGRGGQTAASDVDVMVIGDVSFREVADALHDAQTTIGREVNPGVYSPADWRARARAQHPYVTRVLNEPKVFLIGDADELSAVAGQRLDQAARADGGGNRKPVRPRRPRPARLQGKGAQRRLAV